MKSTPTSTTTPSFFRTHLHGHWATTSQFNEERFHQTESRMKKKTNKQNKQNVSHLTRERMPINRAPSSLLLAPHTHTSHHIPDTAASTTIASEEHFSQTSYFEGNGEAVARCSQDPQRRHDRTAVPVHLSHIHRCT